MERKFCLFILILLSSCLSNNEGLQDNFREQDFTSAVNDMTSPPNVQRAPAGNSRYTNPKLENGAYQNDPPQTYENPSRPEDCSPRLGFSETNPIRQFAQDGLSISDHVQRGDPHRYFDEFLRQGVPEAPLRKALAYFKKNKSKFPNKNYISIADYSQNSRNKRFYMLDMRTGRVHKEQVSHGSGNAGGRKLGDPNHDGMLDRCTHSNGSRTNMTRPGFFKTANPYMSGQNFPVVGRNNGNRYNGLRLVGLENRNKDALSRGVVMHEAYYNREGAVMGRSYGCPAFVPGKAKEIFPRIKGGSMFYAHVPQCE